MINPMLLPLPHSDDMDLIYPASIAEATGYIPATKTAGAHCKAKAPRAKDVKSLLNIVQDELPLGQCRWQTVQVKFCQWAKVKHRPECKLTSLETKFKQLVKTTKPTGDGVCPPEVTCAHHIEELINEHAGTCDLNNTDYKAVQDDDSLSVISDQYQDEPTPPPIQHTAIARSTPCAEAPAPRRNTRGAAATDLLTRLSTAFDPATQRNCDEDRANCSLATTHLLTQSQQLCDSQAATETLHGQLFDLRARMYDIEREHDWVELRIEMMQMSGSTHRQHVRMPKHKNLHQEWYPEGGGSTRWLTDEGESTASEGCKPPHLQKIGPSEHLKYSDCPYFEDIADEPINPIQKEGSVEI
ncbi:uncharacterized protein F5891DRAFT_1187488 [Suillus fuscotomentosus]|uniref:DUF6818 domain-containing protein n=1 Tax=Suillus fuscotomentosus TaxID=1912939 RepID=A0AAD4HMG1_9AGAM|nr:uncharacterized protein F5891DRAFT_1187488 [Suillus fuscotomentosus]KAG1901616.1 hypothetical protein F5891DRAFT_1187488 [Suillus fuscotomentosus]